MPVTFVAHQAPAVALKIWRPSWFDATALCVGTMAPDLLYAVSDAANTDPHQWLPALALGLPLTIIMGTLIRTIVVPEFAPMVPDVGRLRLRSFGVVSHRRPPSLQTLISALVGIATHLALDSFTHSRRLGPTMLGYEDVTVSIAGITRPLAGVFQWIGHIGGSIITVGLLALIARRRLLDRWYGAEAVQNARRTTLTGRHRAVIASGLAAGCLIGVQWGWHAERIEVIQRAAVGVFLGLATAAAALRARREIQARSSHHGQLSAGTVAAGSSAVVTVAALFTAARIFSSEGPSSFDEQAVGTIGVVLAAPVATGLAVFALVRRSPWALGTAVVPSLALLILGITAANVDSLQWNESREELLRAAQDDDVVCSAASPCRIGNYVFTNLEQRTDATLFWTDSHWDCYGGFAFVVPIDDFVFDAESLVASVTAGGNGSHFATASPWREGLVTLCITS